MSTTPHGKHWVEAYHLRADAIRNRALVRGAVAARCRFRDRVCFASLDTLAADTGLHKLTVRDHLLALEADREIERLNRLPDSGRRVRTCVWRFTHGQRRLTKPKRTPCREARTSTTPYKPRGWARPRPRRRCSLAEDLVLFEPPERPPNAHDVMAATIGYLNRTEGGVTVGSRERGILARQAKELLTDGYPPHTVARALVVAWQRGEPHNAWRVCGDLTRAEAGLHIDRADYRRLLNDFADPEGARRREEHQEMYDRLDRVGRERRDRIKRQREEEL